VGLAWEVGAAFMGAIVGLMIVGFLLLQVLASIETERATEARLRVQMEQAANRIETGVSLGIALDDIPDAQSAIERLSATEQAFTSLDVFDANGIFTASTDRASIGRSCPDPWLTAAKDGQRHLRDQRLVIVPLAGAFGDTIGYVVGSYSVPSRLSADWTRFFLALSVVVVVLVAVLIYCAQRMRTPVLETLAAMSGDPKANPPIGAADAIERLRQTEEKFVTAMRALERT
jgi:hypothetical protein